MVGLKVVCVTLGLMLMTGVAAPLKAQDNTNAMLSLFASAQDTIDPVESAANKVKLSRRQAMLGQSMSMYLCYVYLGIDSDDNLRNAAKASALFSESLDAMRSGSVQKKVRKEENKEILAQLEKLDKSWRPLKNTINSILTTREPKREELLQIEAQSIEVQQLTKTVVQLMADTYGSSDLGEEVAKTISFASRQKTLSEKATKEFCWVVADIERQSNLTSLAETRESFFQSIFWLFFGSEDQGILAPTNFELDIHYQELFPVWFYLENIYDQVVDGERPSDEEMKKAMKLTKFLTDRSDEALNMY